MKANYDDARNTLRLLTATGHEAYFAGGCVRDMLLGRPVNDYDITTAATPEDTESILGKAGIRTTPVGASFGVVKAIVNGGELDIATFRTDGAYSDNRRPDSIAYTESAEEDVKRRDFTINSMLMDENERVIDYVGGQVDLKCRLIKCVGNPSSRFGEDALRMMRAVRFAVSLGFFIDRETESAIREHCNSIINISKERITEELTKILQSGHADIGFWILNRTGLWDAYFEKKPDTDDKFVAMHALARITPEDPIALSLAAILVNMYESSRISLLNKLTITNVQKIAINRLLEHGSSIASFATSSLSFKRKMMAWEDADLIIRHVRLNNKWVNKLSWVKAQPICLTEEAIFNHMQEITNLGWPCPLVTGDTLISWGFQPCVTFGDMLDTVRDKQLEGELTTPSQALDFLVKEYPAVPRMINGQIVDGMRRRRYVAQCKRCKRIMSFTATCHPKGFVNWSSVEDKTNVRVDNHTTFSHCQGCTTRKKKNKFVLAVE